MPALSIYFGSSFISFLALGEEGDFKTFRFPYSYSNKLYSHFYAQEDFYTEIIEFAIKKLDLKRTGLEIVATGFPYVPATGFELKHTLTLDKLITSQMEYSPYIVDGWSVYTQSGYKNFDLIQNSRENPEDVDFMSNLGIYTNAKPTDENYYEYYLTKIRDLIALENSTESIVDRPILFSGDFLLDHNKDRGYLFILECLAKPGIYKVALDKENTYLHLQLIKSYNPALLAKTQNQDILPLGTLINSPGDSTFLLKDEVNTSRLVELLPGELFFSPLDKELALTAVIKNAALGSIEKSVTGGKLGLIIDTREKTDTSKFNATTIKNDLAKNLVSLKENLNHL